MIYALISLAVVALLAVFIGASYVKSPPDTAFIISGAGKRKTIVGKASFRIPFFQRIDKLVLKLISIDVKTSSSVPTADYINIMVDSVVNVKVGRTPEMIEIADSKHHRDNLKGKHKKDAAKGWYRYDSRFALPIFTDDGEVERYNVFHASLIVRHAADDKMYLYDIIDIKKETSNPLQS
jgi:hypothetical protein